MVTALVGIEDGAATLTVAGVGLDGWPQVLRTRRIVLGLGRTVERDGMLGPGMRDLLGETALRLRQAAFEAGAGQVEAWVAPSVQAAADLPGVVALLEQQLGVRPRLLDRVEVLTALARGTRARFGAPDDVPRALLSVGDDAIVFGRDIGDEVVLDAAVVGGLRVLMPAGGLDPLHPAVRGRLRSRLDQVLSSLPAPSEVGELVVAGRAARLLATTLVARRYGPTPLATDGLLVSAAEVEALADELAGVTGAQRLLLPAVAPDEADAIAVSATTIAAIVRHLGVDGVRCTTAQPIDGLVLDALGSPPEVTRRTLAEVRQMAVRAASRRGGDDHGARARIEAALGCFDASREVHRLPDEDRELLATAAAVAVAHRSVEQVRALLADGIRGHDPAELIELAALLAPDLDDRPVAPAGAVPTVPSVPIRRNRRRMLRAILAHAQLPPHRDPTGSGPRGSSSAPLVVTTTQTSPGIGGPAHRPRCPGEAGAPRVGDPVAAALLRAPASRPSSGTSEHRPGS